MLYLYNAFLCCHEVPLWGGTCHMATFRVHAWIPQRTLGDSDLRMFGRLFRAGAETSLLFLVAEGEEMRGSGFNIDQVL